MWGKPLESAEKAFVCCFFAVAFVLSTLITAYYGHHTYVAYIATANGYVQVFEEKSGKIIWVKKEESNVQGSAVQVHRP